MNKKWWITQATFLKERASREEELAASPPQPARRTGAAREGPAEHPPGTVGAAWLAECECSSAARCKKSLQLLAFDLRCRLLTRMQTLAQDENRFVANSPGNVSFPTAATFLLEMSEKSSMMTRWQIPLLRTLRCSLEMLRQREIFYAAGFSYL